jgi:hypothetical protein
MIRSAFILSVIVLTSCTPTRYVVPLLKREKAFSISYGGPVMKDANAVMPVPLVNVTYAKGKSDRLTYFGGLHLTPAVEGYFAGEVGALKEWYYNGDTKLGFTTNFVVNLMADKWEGKLDFIPQFDANLYWHFKGDPHYHCDCPGDPKYGMFTYFGFQSHYKVVSNYDYIAPFKDDLLFSPHFGFSFGASQWKLNTEIKWIQPWVDNTEHDPEIWNPAMPTGTFGGYLTFYYTLE